MLYNETSINKEVGRMSKGSIYFDMDGTLADFYGVDDWLGSLMRSETKPYREAKPLVNMHTTCRLLNMLQQEGYRLCIVSWLSKSGSPAYNNRIVTAKLNWLAKHMGSVVWDEIRIINYGTPKHTVVADPTGILFDDEEGNRKAWPGTSYDVDCIEDTLRDLVG